MGNATSGTGGVAIASRHPRPAAQPPRPYQFPRFERLQLPNGMHIVVAPISKLPVVSVMMLVDAGAVSEPAGRDGVAQLTAKLLLEGTTKSQGAALIERFERLGASIESRADWDIAAVTMTSLTDNLRSAFAIFGEVLRTPAFPVREVERLKAERSAELLQLRAEPRGLADEMFSRVLYESTSRYARPDGGDERSVAGISREDVLSFYETRYGPSSMTLVVAGDVSVSDAEGLARDTFGDWSGEVPPAPTTSDTPARVTRAVHLVAKADAAQSELRVGHVGLPRQHPDYFPATLMNAVLGGLFSSRINLNLREAHGYTYGAHSYFDWRRQSGPWVVSTAVQSEVTEASAREILNEIDRIRSEAISADELSLATSYLDGVFPIRYETTAAIAAALANLVIYGLPDDWYDRYRARVRAVTTKEVLTAAQRHLHPQALQILVVGNPTAIRAPLEGLGFGPMTLYDAEGMAKA